MNEQQIFRIIKLLGENCFDGHFTIMRFTTNWRVSFGYQPQSNTQIQEMACDADLLGAFVKALELAPWAAKPERPVKP
jgi:hypothetical protein